MERTETAEIEALRDNFATVPAGFAEEFGVASLDLGDSALAVRVSTSPANLYLSAILAARIRCAAEVGCTLIVT